MRLRSISYLFVLVLVVCSCSTDELPQALSEPFINTKVQLATNTVPSPGSTISPGQVTFDLRIAYTLSEQDDASRQNLFLFTDFFAVDGNGNFVGDIGLPPDAGEALPTASAILNRSFTFNIPSNIEFVRARLQIEDLITGDFLFFDFDWQVQ